MKTRLQTLARCWVTGLTLILGLAVMGCTWAMSPRAGAQGTTGEDESRAFSHYEIEYFKARLAMESRDREMARALLTPLIEQPGCPDFVFQALVELEIAEVSLAEHLTEQPGSRERLANHDELAQQVREAYEKARRLIEQGLAENPDSIELSLLQARLAAKRGEFDLAVEQLESVLDDAPHRADVLEELSDLHLEKLQHVRTPEELDVEIGKLIDVYERMLVNRQGYERLTALLVINQLCNKLGDHDKALKYAREAVEVNSRELRSHLALAETLTAIGQHEEALDAYREALRIDSQSADVRAGLEETLSQIEDPAVRHAFFGELAANFPAARDLQTLAAQTMYETGHAGEGDAILAHVRATWPDQAETIAEILMYRAQAQRSAGETEAALATYAELLPLDPDNPELQLHLEAMFAELDRPEARTEFYLRVASENPENAQVQERAARAFLTEEQWPEAERILLHIADTWPDNARARIALVTVWLEQGELKKAGEMAMRMSAAGDETAPAAVLLVAEANINAEKLVEAASLLEQLMKSQPDNMLATMLAMQVYAGLERYDDAHNVLDHVPVDLREKHASDLLYLRAGLFSRQDQPAKALEVFQKLIEMHADQSMYYREAGIVAQEMGRMDEAENYYKQALELDPDDPENNNTLAYFYAETNQRLDAALELVGKALAVEPDAGHIVDTLGWIRYRRGEFESAVNDLERAIELMRATPDPILFDHLGDAHLANGDVEAALQAWRKALELDGKVESDIRAKIEKHSPSQVGGMAR